MKAKFMPKVNIVIGTAMLILSVILLLNGISGGKMVPEPFMVTLWFENLSAAAYPMLFTGIYVLLAGIFEIFTEKKRSRQEKIEADDERNIAVANAAAAGAFELLSSLLFIAILMLQLLGQLKTAALITLYAVNIVSQIFLASRRQWLNNKI